MKNNLPELPFASSSNRIRNEAILVTDRPGTTGFIIRRFAAERLDQLVALKERIAAKLEDEFTGTLGSPMIRQIVTEAEALATTTPYPALFFPALAEEKVRRASNWAVRQQIIRNRSLTALAEEKARTASNWAVRQQSIRNRSLTVAA